MHEPCANLEVEGESGCDMTCVFSVHRSMKDITIAEKRDVLNSDRVTLFSPFLPFMLLDVRLWKLFHVQSWERFVRRICRSRCNHIKKVRAGDVLDGCGKVWRGFDGGSPCSKLKGSCFETTRRGLACLRDGIVISRNAISRCRASPLELAWWWVLVRPRRWSLSSNQRSQLRKQSDDDMVILFPVARHGLCCGSCWNCREWEFSTFAAVERIQASSVNVDKAQQPRP